jgi:hypothetical protein
LKKTGPECILERTKDTTIVPSIFYYGNYVYVLNSWLVRAEEKSVYEIVRWNTESKVLENIMYLETDGNHGDAESIWVENEQNVYFSVTSDEDLFTNVYLINENEVSKVIEFGAWVGIRLQQGAAVWFNMNEDRSALAVKICDYSGNEIYEGTLSSEYYEGIEGPDGEGFGFSGFSALMGDSHNLILIEHIRSEKSSKEMAFLVRYTITPNGAEYHLLGKTFWR